MADRYTSTLQNSISMAELSAQSSGAPSSEFDELYTSYGSSSNPQVVVSPDPTNDSQDSLDSNSNQVGDNSPPVRKAGRMLNPTRAQAVFQSLNETGLINSSPKTPRGYESPGSTDSFDFTIPTSHSGLQSSSLNVLLDTPTSENEYRQLVATPPIIEMNFLNNGRRGESPGRLDTEQDDSSNVALSLQSDSNDNWAERGGAEKTVSHSSSGVDYKVIRRTVKDFEFGKDIGEGSYSTVVLATDKLTNTKYAVKILDKRHIIKEKKVKYVNIEKHALNRLSGCPGIISLFFTFQDKHSLYFVLDFAANGELLSIIKQYGTLNEECTRHFGAQMLDAIQYMHDNGVIHRDIKPENVLLDEKFRIQITDFGTAKLLEKSKNDDTGEEEDYPVDVRAKSFVGTAEYVSPELLESKFCGKPGDIWAFGCILYQLIAGKPPFKATNEYLTFQKITKLQYAFSAGFPLVLRDLIKQVLVLQPSRRATIAQIKKHHFFHGINFDDTDAIWNTPMPELGPYKMTAKSMMKMPATNKNTPAKKIIRIPGKKKATPEASPQPQERTPQQKRVTSDNTNGAKSQRNLGAASAAYALNKQENDDSQTSLPNIPPSTSSRKPSGPEYIPGTNILRPVINCRQNFSRSSVNQSSTSVNNSTAQLEKVPSKSVEVPPISSVELAWKDYLHDDDERVLHVGQAIVCKQPTEYFERKHKGLIHNAPLKYVSQLQAAAKVGGNDSLLTRVARDNQGGLRRASEPTPSVANEKDAILEFNLDDDTDSKIKCIPEDESLPTSPVDGDDEQSTSSSKEQSKNGKSAANLGKRFFKKFMVQVNPEKSEAVTPDSASTKSNSSGGVISRKRSASVTLDKAKNCTLVLTSHGRFLIFIKEGASEPRLVNEILLNYPFITIKEVVTNHAAKFGKIIPVTGIFAVQAIESTFVFEVNKYEVDVWTTALAKSKLAQFERERELTKPKLMESASIKTPPTTSNRTFDPYDTHGSSPIVSTPTSRTTGRGSVESKRTEKAKASQSPKEPEATSPRQSLDPKGHSMFKNKAKQSKSLKRKPPPPLPKGNISNAGLSRDSSHADSETLQAALLAVNNHPSQKINEDVRSSSFSKSKSATPASNISYKFQTPTNGKARITAMNSKLLTRTRAKQ